MSFISAKNAKVRLGSYTFKGTKWTAKPKGQKLETTNFDDAGYGTYIGGILDLDITIEGNYDLGQAPLASFPPGTIVSSLKLYLNDTTGNAYVDCTNFYVEDCEIGAEVRGLVTFKITGNSTGAFTGVNGSGA